MKNEASLSEIIAYLENAGMKIDTADKSIGIPKEIPYGAKFWGKIDFLVNYHKFSWKYIATERRKG